MSQTTKSTLAAVVTLIVAVSVILSGCSSGGGASTIGVTGASGSDTAAADSAPGKGKVVRIGYQKYGTMNILKAKGTLDKRLEAEGYKVTWTEFPGGPQLLEALNAGSVDIGHTGEAPPIFAQAAGTPLVYLGHEQASPGSEGILVPKNSQIKTVADLKGKKIAFNKGSNVHYLLVKALEHAGLKYEDVTPVFLAPGDARVAFENGSVDAWVIWDPFLAAAQTATDARLLTDGKGLVANNEFYLASRTFAEQNKPVIDALLEELNKTDQWAKDNKQEVAKLLSPQLGIDVPSLELAADRRSYGPQPMDNSVIEAQQKIADTFFALGLIPKKIQVQEAILK